MSDDESGQSVNLPVSVATRISSQDEDKLEQYMDQEDVGKSVAVRQLLRAGLERELRDRTNRVKAYGEGMLLTGVALTLIVLTDNPIGAAGTAAAIALLVVGYLFKFKSTFVVGRLF